MKSPAERGRIGAWAYEARADADLSVEEVVERLARAGQPVAAATIRGIEGGSKQPSRRLLRALAGVYGRPVPGDNAAGTAGDTQTVPASLFTDLLAKLGGQADAITSLVEELRLARARDAETEGRLRAIEAELRSLRERREVEGPSARPFPHAKAGSVGL